MSLLLCESFPDLTYKNRERLLELAREAMMPGDNLLAGITRKQEEAVLLKFWLDLTETEVAEVLGCSQPVLHRRVETALAKLKVILMKRYEGFIRNGGVV